MDEESRWKRNSYSSSTPPDDGATKVIALIMETLGLEASFEARRAKVPNAAAVVYQGKRYILYNPTFIGAMNKAAGTPWAAIAILAHEIGHHLNGHTLDGKGSMPAIELEADEFSGFVLRKMGASLPEAQVAMRILASAKATKTHPARSDRLLAIASGWNHADEQLKKEDLVGQSTPSRLEDQALIAEKYIAFDVHFNFDPETKYHVTTRHNLVKVADDEIHILGRVFTTGKSSYPLAFHTGSDDVFLINSKGQIFNRQGKTLGYLTSRQ